MKVPPIQLPTGMDRLPLPLPFSPDLLWRYPNPFISQPPPSPLETHVRSGLPVSLPSDPKGWSREDVAVFLAYCEKEFDLEKIDMDKFQMNGKALCFLSKNDLAERCSGAGDVIHNILQMLLREASSLFPSSPLTPRPPGLITPTSPFASHWPLLNSSASETFPNLSHLISQTNSVTLSPNPSLDSTSGHSPKQELGCGLPPLYLPNHLTINSNHLTSTHSSNSDSEDSMVDSSQRSPPTPATPTSSCPPKSPSSAPSSSVKGEGGEEAPSTNGRLLWDFLQQLLNDPGQRYTAYIQWKNKESGVFKIVDPAGLARLWGIQKNHLSMNYDKMSRALRYYYRVNILRKVQGERHCYQFLRNPSELKSIKNISLLRQQMEAQAAAQQLVAQNAVQMGGNQPQTSLLGSSQQRSPISSIKVEEPVPAVSPHPDEPTDLTTSAGREREERERERQERERYYTQLMERYNIERASPSRDRTDDREEAPRNHFDYRNLIPQVSIKTE